MEINKYKADLDGQRKRKRKQEDIDALCAKKRTAATGIENLPDDILIAILSRMSVKDAVRTSILSTRWRYLWMFISGTLEFDDREFNGGDNSILVKRKKFKARLRHVLKLHQGREISSPFKKTPNLTELTLGGEFCQSFIFEPNKHSSYSVQLVKLVLNVKTRTPERTTVPPDLPQLYSLKRLELNIVSIAFRSLFFFMSLIKASPNLQEFKMKIAYLTYNRRFIVQPEVARMPFPDVTRSTYEGFCHKNLKVVEMSGLMGYTTEAEFIIELLCKVAPSIEMVLFDTRTDYCHFNPLVDIVTAKEGAVIMYNIPGGRAQTKIWARKVIKKCPSRINFVIT